MKFKKGALLIEDFNRIFCAFDKMEELHKEMVHETLVNIEDYPRMLMGKSLMLMSRRLEKQYHEAFTSYVENFDEAMKTLARVRENGAVENQLILCKNSELGGDVELEDLMLMPFQFIVMLKNNIKKLYGLMNKTDPDYEGCDQYIEFLEGIMVILRKSSIWSMEEEKLHDALRKFYGSPSSMMEGATQVLHMEDCMWHVEAGNQTVILMLLNDSMVVASRGYMSQCAVNKVITLEGLRVEDPEQVARKEREEDGEGEVAPVRPHSFIIDNPLHGIREEFSCSSDPLKRKWMTEINEAIKKAYMLHFTINGSTVSEHFFDTVNNLQGQVVKVKDVNDTFMEGVGEEPSSKPAKVPRIAAIPKVVESEKTSTLTPRPDKALQLQRAVVMNLRMLEDKFNLMMETMADGEHMIYEPLEREIAKIPTPDPDEVAADADDEELDFEELLESVFTDLDMMAVNDDDKHQRRELERMETNLKKLRSENDQAEPMIGKLEVRLKEVTKELGKNRDNLIASYQKRGFIYMINRSESGVKKREYQELIASLYNTELCFVTNMHDLDGTAAHQMRMLMGKVPNLIKQHELLLAGYENAMGKMLCIGPALLVWARCLTSYAEYLKEFDSNNSMRKNNLNTSSKKAEHDKLMKTDEWSGLDLASFLMMPVDHLFQMGNKLHGLQGISNNDVLVLAPNPEPLTPTLTEGIVKYHARLWVQLAGQAQEDADLKLKELRKMQDNNEDPNLIAKQQKDVDSAEGHLARMKKETDDYVEELTIINNVADKITTILGVLKFSRVLTERVKVFEDLKQRLCGDISCLTDAPGRREVISKEICIMSSGQLRGLTIFVFNDVIITTAAGSSKEFEIFQHKIELYKMKVEAVGARLKLTEHDVVSGGEKSLHTFECDTEETAHMLKEHIEMSIRVLTRTIEARVKPDNFVEVKENETLEELNERLINEVANMKKREKGVDKKLREQMDAFVELRSQQWDTDYERAQKGLTVDPRTLNALTKIGGVTGAEATAGGEGMGGMDPEFDEEAAEAEEQQNKAKAAEVKAEEDAAHEEKAAFIMEKLDSLIYKYDALEEVMTNFTRLHLYPEEAASEAAAALAAAAEVEATAEAEEVPGEEEEAAPEEEEEEEEEEEAAPEEEASSEEEAQPGEAEGTKEAEEFWDVITRVRGALSVLGGKMSQLDEQFWSSRMGKPTPQAKKLPPELEDKKEEVPVMSASEIFESLQRVEAELTEEVHRAETLKKERTDRQEVVDNALRNLQNVGKKAHLIHKK